MALLSFGDQFWAGSNYWAFFKVKVYCTCTDKVWIKIISIFNAHDTCETVCGTSVAACIRIPKNLHGNTTCPSQFSIQRLWSGGTWFWPPKLKKSPYRGRGDTPSHTLSRSVASLPRPWSLGSLAFVLNFFLKSEINPTFEDLSTPLIHTVYNLMVMHTFNTENCSCMYMYIFLIHTILYNQVVYLPMDLYYLCIDFVHVNCNLLWKNTEMNQIKSNQNSSGGGGGGETGVVIAQGLFLLIRILQHTCALLVFDTGFVHI